MGNKPEKFAGKYGDLLPLRKRKTFLEKAKSANEKKKLPCRTNIEMQK